MQQRGSPHIFLAFLVCRAWRVAKLIVQQLVRRFDVLFPILEVGVHIAAAAQQQKLERLLQKGMCALLVSARDQFWAFRSSHLPVQRPFGDQSSIISRLPLFALPQLGLQAPNLFCCRRESLLHLCRS